MRLRLGIGRAFSTAIRSLSIERFSLLSPRPVMGVRARTSVGPGLENYFGGKAAGDDNLRYPAFHARFEEMRCNIFLG